MSRLRGIARVTGGPARIVFEGASTAELGGLRVAAAGRLDDTDAIRRALPHGHPPLTPVSSVADWVLGAYRVWGVDCPRHLLGEVALAVWDARHRRLLLARDVLGIEDLHWTETEGGVAFDTRPHALARPGRGADLFDRRALAAFLVGDDRPGSRSPYAGVSALPPAHRLVMESGRLRTERYWAPPTPDGVRWTFAAAAEAVREAVDRAVRDRMRDVDGPVGVTLSGGLDSGTVASFAARALPAEGVSGNLLAVTFGFDRLAGCDERVRARRLANSLGMGRIEVVADRHGLLRSAGFAADGPFVGWDAAHDEGVARVAAAGGRVLLTGHGGDDLFGGDRAAYAAGFWQGDLGRALTVIRSAGVQEDGRLSPPAALRGLAQHLAPAWARDLRGRWGGQEDGEETPWLGPAIRRAMRDAGGLAAASRLDLLGCRAALGWHRRRAAPWGVEVRHPLLDRRLVELLATLPPDLLVAPGTVKPLLRSAAVGVMPEAERRDARKVRLGALSRASLEEERETISGWWEAPRVADLGLVDADGLRGAWDRFSATSPGHLSIWRTALLEAWLRSDVLRIHGIEDEMPSWSTEYDTSEPRAAGAPS